MSIINCSKNCIYEDDGKCTLDHVDIVSCTSVHDCSFFQERKKKEPKLSDIINKNLQ